MHIPNWMEKCQSIYIVPLHKKGNVNDVKNYRPISILSTTSKIIERVVHKQFYEYLMKPSILSKAQFGISSRVISTNI